MTETAAQGSVRFFRSFSAVCHPVQPIEPLEYAEARALATYYEARYDENGRLSEYIKHSRSDRASPAQWSVAFTELYDYFEDGNIRKRTLRTPGQSDQTWTFDERALPWSDYFDRLAGVWFADARDEQSPTPEQLALLVHEQFTNLQARVLKGSPDRRRDNQWVVETVLAMLPGVRAIVDEIHPDSSPAICALGWDQIEGFRLEGFDEPPPNLSAVAEDPLSRLNEVQAPYAISIAPQTDLDPEARDWAAASGIGSITMAPMKVFDEGKLTCAVAVFVLTTKPLSAKHACLLNSMVRRFVQQLEALVETARIYESRDHETRGR